MKIDYVIIGSNDNPIYFDFWPIISKIWVEVFNITPVLGLICNEDSDFIEDSYGLIKKFKSIENINTGLQSQIVRHWLSKELTGNILISDIDMVPLSKEYFVEQIKNFDDTKFYVMSSDNFECNNNREIPMCYNIANSKVYSQILDLGDTWENFAIKLNSMGFGWTTDQRYLWDKVQEQKFKNSESVVFLNRGWSYNGADRRIDRINWSYDPNLVRNGYYIDSHLLRPYNENKEEIDKLINLLW